LFAAAAFFYGGALNLHWQLLILCIGAFAGVFSFAVVEIRGERRNLLIKYADS
jgi:hypothetical protein